MFLDYHIEFERRYYSVPYRLIGKSVDLRITRHMIEVYYRGQSVARHLKAAGESALHHRGDAPARPASGRHRA